MLEIERYSAFSGHQPRHPLTVVVPGEVPPPPRGAASPGLRSARNQGEGRPAARSQPGRWRLHGDRLRRRPVYAPDPGGWWTFADGREPNYRNLMIQYWLTDTFNQPEQLVELLLGKE